MSSFDRLHPALQYHIVNSLGWSSLRPTQLEAIDPIHDGLNCLLLAPTAGGKTEAAVIPVLSRMLTEHWAGISVLYVCPIKALLNNLEPRLSHYAGLLGRRIEVWHGDVGASRKKHARADPPDILLTTPESLEGMLISPRTDRQAWFGKLRVVIVDELHAFANDDRGWHLRAVLSRLDRYTPAPLQRIGLSATVGNPAALLDWFAPVGARQVVGSSAVSTDAEVMIDHVGSLDNAATVIERLHRGEKRLVFCDSRGNAERLGNALNQLGVRTFVSHASLSVSERRQAEEAFATERNCVIVATSTLELGLDVGDLDRVIQIDAPATVSAFLQRMGRTGRRAGSRRNCLFLATTDPALLLTLGITEMWSRAWVENAQAAPLPWNVLAQQALLLTLEAGQRPRAELLQALRVAFPELPAAEISAAVGHLVSTTFLDEPSQDLIQIGPEAERVFGRAHYRELLATFTGSDLLTAKHGMTELGYVDPSVVGGDAGPAQILLAGRSWAVREVDWKKRVVWLEPTTSGGGKARWIGGARSIGPDVARAIRDVLYRGTVTPAKLSRRATLKLEELRDLIPTALNPPAIEPSGSGKFRLWTFAGTKVNRTLAKQWAGEGASNFDELGVDFRVDPRASNLPPAAETVCLSASEIEVHRRSVKFAEMLNSRQINSLVAARLFDAVGPAAPAEPSVRTPP